MMDFLILAGSVLAKGLSVGVMLTACVMVCLLEVQSVRKEA